MVDHYKTIEIVRKKFLESDFEPSMKTLSRILKSMKDHPIESKTRLSLDTKLNYARLARHLIWLEKKGFVESIMADSKIIVVLTKRGKEFASTIS